MTIKHKNRTVSAENEEVVNNVSFNSSSMILTFTKKNLLTGETSSPLECHLNDFKLKLEKVNSLSDLNTIANSNSSADKTKKETCIFLVPLDESDGQDADEYAEYIWFENKGKFEKIGTTRIDLNNKVDKVNGKSLIDDTLITKLNGIEAEANKTVTVDTATDGELKPITSNRVYNEVNPLKGRVSTAESNITTLGNNKQNKEDSSLTTENKNITGAINEINNAIQNFSSTNLYRITQDMVDTSGTITSITIDTTDEFFFIVPDLNITSQVSIFYINRKDSTLLTADKTLFRSSLYAVYKKNSSYYIHQISNDNKSFVDAVTNDVLKPVTSNAVYDALELKVDKIDGKGLSSNDFTNTYKTALDNLSTTYATKTDLNSKVDKVNGKALSSNDFTNTYKTALDGLSTTYATKQELAEAEIDPSSVNLDGYLTINNASQTYATKTEVSQGLSSKVDKDGEKGLSENDFTDAYKTALDGLSTTYATKSDLSSKVDKVNGKGLSENDFTDTYKNTLDNLSTNYASKNDLNSKVDKVNGKGLSENDFTGTYKNTLDNLSTNYAAKSDLNSKVDKVTGKGLSENDFTTAYKTELDDLSTNYASKNDLSSKVDKIDGKGLSENDFTTAYKTELDDLSTNYASKNDLSSKEDDSNKVTTLDSSNSHYPSCSAVNEALTELINKIYPVGAIYMSLADINPATQLGVGVWQPIPGKFLIGASSSYPAGTMGGSALPTLVEHNHLTLSDGNKFLTTSGDVKINSDERAWPTKQSGSGLHLVYCETSATIDEDVKTADRGGNVSDGNLPPYLAVYIWKRVS